MRWIILVLCLVAAAIGWGEALTNPAPGEVQFAPANTDTMYEVYTRNTKHGTPTFITSDSVLYSAHVLFDYTLRAAEVKHFDATLRTLTARMLAQVNADQEAFQHNLARMDLAGPPTPWGYNRVSAYFSVAQLLLDPEPLMTHLQNPLALEEFKLINAADSVAMSPILGVTEDYTQYKPRGHYTRNETLQRYFRAMMWYGRAGFQISGEKAPGVPLTLEEKRANALAGIAIANALAEDMPAKTRIEQGALALWQSLFAPTEYLVGHSDDLTPPDYIALAHEVFPHGVSMAWTEETQAQVDDFIAQAVKLHPPRIVGGIQGDKQPGPPAALRFMGQRFIPDSYFFQQLVHPKVAGRFMPTGLDVMAVLGSRRAKALLDARGEMQKYPDYAGQLAKLQAELATWKDADWRQTSYTLWLRTLQRVAADPTLQDTHGYADLPPWWTGTRWQDKQLNAALGSWAELRHDTILYAKQSTTMMMTGMMPMQPREAPIYVEPVPDVYNNIALMLTGVRQVLTKNGVFPDEMAQNYDDFQNLLQTLSIVAWQEAKPLNVNGVPRMPNDDDWARLRGIGDLLKGIETLPPALAAELTNDEDAQVALVADVHTDPNHGQVLEVAVGKVMTVAVPVKDGDAVVMAVGPIFSYTEFTHPMTNRLTDAAWQAMLKNGTAPAPLLVGEKAVPREK